LIRIVVIAQSDAFVPVLWNVTTCPPRFTLTAIRAMTYLRPFFIIEKRRSTPAPIATGTTHDGISPPDGTGAPAESTGIAFGGVTRVDPIARPTTVCEGMTPRAKFNASSYHASKAAKSRY